MTDNIQTSSKEIWKPIAGYEGSYEVSNHGRVRSLDRIIIYSGGRQRPHLGRILKRGVDNYGYLIVGLCVGGKRKTKTIHRLVLVAFSDESCDDAVTMHLDNDRQNNYIGNLQWGTQAENNKQRDDEGRTVSPLGETHGRSKLTEKQVLEIRALHLKRRTTLKKLGLQFNVDWSTIGSVIRRETWKHI